MAGIMLRSVAHHKRYSSWQKRPHHPDRPRHFCGPARAGVCVSVCVPSCSMSMHVYGACACAGACASACLCQLLCIDSMLQSLTVQRLTCFCFECCCLYYCLCHDASTAGAVDAKAAVWVQLEKCQQCPRLCFDAFESVGLAWLVASVSWLFVTKATITLQNSLQGAIACAVQASISFCGISLHLQLQLLHVHCKPIPSDAMIFFAGGQADQPRPS